jgi:hypothetical protein
VEAFRVTCETCRSRLKIRSPEVIGQIHACPKCGSMVQIVPPAGWNAADAVPVAAAAVVAATALTTPASAEPPLSISPSISEFAPTDFGIDLQTAPPTAIPTEQFAFEPTPPAPVAAVAGISPVVWCAIGGAAVFVVCGLTYVLWPGGAKESPKPAVASAAAPSASAADKTSRANDQPAPPTDVANAVDHSQDAVAEAKSAPSDPAPATNPPTATAASESAKPPASPSPVAAAELNQTKVEATPAAAPAPVNAPALEATKIAIASPPAPASTPRPDAAQTASAGNHVLKFDPLDFDPEHLSLSSIGSTPANSTASVPATTSIPAVAPPAEASPAAKPPAANEPSADDLFPPVNASQPIKVQRGPVVSGSASPVDAAQRLAIRVKSLQLPEMPLGKFAEIFGGLSGVPITLDPITLELNGVSARTVVSVDSPDATLEQILRATLAAQRLELVERDAHVGVTTTNGDQQHSVDFDVKDLAKSSDAAPVAALIEHFVAPSTWQSAGGKGTIAVDGTTLHIDQSLFVRREALIFCERLRLARGASLRTKYPAELLTVDAPYGKLNTKLNQSTTFTFLAGTPLADIVERWEKLSGVTILVDWSALADIDLNPSTTVACSAIERPWSAAFDGILEPLNLGWWVVDGQTIQITSLEALAHIERVEFYPVPKGLRDQFPADGDLTNTLEKEIAARPKRPGKAGNPHLEIDGVSGRLIVRAAPDIHRFLAGRLVEGAK